MSRKGFTIVELAIVLVVIGIILGMAVKGKALVDAARMRAEVAKLNKFEAASYTYYARTNNLPEAETNSTIKNEKFIDRELLTNRDFDDRISGDNWTLTRCEIRTADNQSFGPNVNANGICARNGSSGATMSARLACNIEVMKDDDNTTSGEGRGWAGVLTNWPATTYQDCDSLPASQKAAYAFKVF